MSHSCTLLPGLKLRLVFMLPSWHPPEKMEQVWLSTYSKGETQCSSPFQFYFCNFTEVLSIPRTSRNFHEIWSCLHLLLMLGRSCLFLEVCDISWPKWLGGCSSEGYLDSMVVLRQMGCRAGRRNPLFYPNVMLEVPTVRLIGFSKSPLSFIYRNN